MTNQLIQKEQENGDGNRDSSWWGGEGPVSKCVKYVVFLLLLAGGFIYAANYIGFLGGGKEVVSPIELAGTAACGKKVASSVDSQPS